jgi:pyridoxal/pyridoxine/pyridoxamine kinase
LEDTVSAAAALARPAAVVTSAPGRSPGELANVLVEAAGAVATFSPRRKVNAHGTGDFFAAALLARLLSTASREAALGRAAAAIDLVLDATGQGDELELIATQELWAGAEAPSAPVQRIPLSPDRA